MTDNRTTELLDGLRNVGNLHEFAELFGFDWHDESDWTWHDVAVKMADELEQAIAATLGNGTLTAEQVREAIFNGSSYASYDGAKYYADGIGMQAIADELNVRAERTCELEPLSALDVTFNMLDQTEWGACSECGCAVPMDARFCNECGKAVKR